LNEERAKLKINVKMLYSEKVKEIKKEEHLKLLEMKFLPETYDFPSMVISYGNRVVTIVWLEEPFAFMIKSEEVTLEIIYEVKIPRITPIIPPAKVRMIDSIKNWVVMCLDLAPTALRKPISRVLSWTVASIIFIIPKPPTTSAMAEIATKKNLSALVILEMASRPRRRS